MSAGSYTEYLQVEIVKGSDEHFELINDDLVEYAPDEIIEYIEIEEFPTTTTTKPEKQDITTNVIPLAVTSLFPPISRKPDGEFKCSNRKCKKEKVSFEAQDQLDEHNKMHELLVVERSQCPICNKILANANKLSVHMSTRHVLKVFTCDGCGRQFNSKDNLRLHMTHHRKHFYVECRACKRGYKSIQSLRYHLRQHFENYQCECCGRVFEHKKLLLGHIAAKHNQELMVPCRFCSRTFSRNDVKETHEREIHNNSQSSPYFQCNECDSAFDMRDDLMSHKILTHYTGNIHACGECGKSFKKKSLLDIHMSTHKEKSIQCESCKMMFTFMSGLNKHRKLGRCKGPQMEKTKHTPEEVARIAKEQLDEITVNPKKAEKEENVFRDLQVPESIEIVKVEARAARRLSFKDDLKDLEAKEDTEYFTITTFGIEEKEKNSPSLKLVVTNEEVVKSSSGRIIKRKHPMMFPMAPPNRIYNIKKKHNVPFECDTCGEKLKNKIRLISHLNSHVKELKHKCSECSRSFQNIIIMKHHYAKAHQDRNPYKEKKYQCNLCPKRYLTDFLLGQHKLSHENRKGQKCDHCDFATNTLYDLRNHIKRIHMATKTFTCQSCGKGFKRRCDMLNHHKAVHAPMKVYVKCPVCTIIILQKGLASHMNNRHSEKGKLRPFVCPVCGKAERYEKNLQRHYQSVHEPTDRGVIYQCSECPVYFYRRRELREHSFIHFNGPTFDCATCHKLFKSRKELTNHEYTHRCTKWPCPVCEIIFQTKSGRSKHMRKFHSEIKEEDSDGIEALADEQQYQFEIV